MDDPASISALQRLPAVGALLHAPSLLPLIERHGRAAVTDATRQTLQDIRETLRNGAPCPLRTLEDPAEILAWAVEAVRQTLSRHTRLNLRRLINATGVVLHTNLGRAVLAEDAQRAIAAVASGYSNTEFDIEEGHRGDRHAHVSALIAQLLQTEAAIAVNNCAGAVLLMLASLCRGGEVIVARGQLVEIGGGFRIPDVMRESNATLVEVGTTNKVYARDYREAITERTRAILTVHRSNFAIVGFTAEPSWSELSEVCREANIPLLVDQGSGLLASDQALGDAAAAIASEPRPLDPLREGADLVAFSGDKLLGGPQAGIVAGKTELLKRVRKHPLARALRADKLTMAGLEATLRLYRDGRAHEIPAIRDLALAPRELKRRALVILRALERHNIPAQLLQGASVPGGGSLPLVELPTWLVLAGGPAAEGRALEQALRNGDPPIVTRFINDRVAIDPRTLQAKEVETLGDLIQNAWGRLNVQPHAESHVERRRI